MARWSIIGISVLWITGTAMSVQSADRFYQGAYPRSYRAARTSEEPGLFFIETTVGGYSRDIEERITDPAPGGATVTAEGTADTTRLLARFGIRPIPILELYGLVGGADLTIDEFDFSGDFDVAYGGGARLTFYQSPIYPGLKFYIEGNALQFESGDIHLVQLHRSDGTLLFYDFQNEKIRWTEYTGMVGIRGRYFLTEPYGGVRASWVSARDRIPGFGDLHIRQQDAVGLFAGADIYLDRSRTVAINVEATAIDQNSIRGGLRFNF